MMRGVAANWWYEGAEGIYLFNPFVPVDGGVIPAETMYGEFKTIGDPKTLTGFDKLFCQDHVEDMTYTSNIMMNRMTAPAPLPTPISTTAKTIPLLVADAGIREKGAKMTLELQTQPTEANAALVVQLNGQLLTNAKLSVEQVEFDVEMSPLRQGYNQVTVALSAGKATLKALRLWVRYS